MRQFSIDSPEFFCFQLEGAKKVYKIPLGNSMTNEQVIAFEETDGDYKKQVDWLRGFIGDVVDTLTPQVTGEILRAWSMETRSQGASLGES